MSYYKINYRKFSIHSLFELLHRFMLEFNDLLSFNLNFRDTVSDFTFQDK